jgi:hypothetical protein
MRRDEKTAPDASIVIPVNAKGDLENVRRILQDLADYQGDHSLEMVLMINNYDEGNPPGEIDEFADLGILVDSAPSIRRVAEAPGLTARVRGTRSASADFVVLFDADCRVPNATALVDWYVAEYRAGAHAAYSHVDYYDLRDTLPNRVRIWVHHAARWIKRTVIRIPTVRGSNYAIDRGMFLKLYDEGWVADDMNVGPTCRAIRAKVAYSESEEHVVLTSGRMFSGTSWSRLSRYLLYRFRYNLRVLRVRRDAARFTHRESDPERRYVNNRPVY